MKIKLLGGLLVATTITALGVAILPTIQAQAQVLGVGNYDPIVLQCGEYTTNQDWNISYDEIYNLTKDLNTTSQLDGHESAIKDCSEIIESVVSVKGQLYHIETVKEGQPPKIAVDSLKFGTGSNAGSLTLTLTKDIDAIGFYAEAYQNTADQTDKHLLVNGISTTSLGNSYVYDITNYNQRFFIEFDEPTNEISISAADDKNNRFYIYSIGFYSKNNFPEHQESGEDIPVENFVEFTPNNFSGQGTSGSGSAISATINGITFSCNKGFGTTQIRCYSGGQITITAGSKTIVKIEFTFSGSYNGDLDSVYNISSSN